MIEKEISRSRALVLGVTLGFAALASAHPGPPGHTHHPDEVDEFEQVSSPVEAPASGRDLMLGVLALGLSVCAGYMFLQRTGNLKDAVAKL